MASAARRRTPGPAAHASNGAELVSARGARPGQVRRARERAGHSASERSCFFEDAGPLPGRFTSFAGERSLSAAAEMYMIARGIADTLPFLPYERAEQQPQEE